MAEALREAPAAKKASLPKPAKSKGEQMKAMEIKLIKMGQAHLGWDDELYRATMARLCGGKTSSTALTWQERKALLDYMKANGFVVKSNKPHAGGAGGRAWDNGMSKLRAIWYALADAGAVKRPETTEQLDEAINTWAKRMQPRISHVRFASGVQVQLLIEAAKKWAKRVGAAQEGEQGATRV
jgi:phage gp16-like protein